MMAGAVLIASVVLSACSSVTPNAGEEAVLVKQPWVFGSGGVVSEPVTTGQVWTALSTSAVIVNMQPQRFDVQFDDLMSSDGVPLDFHAMLTLQVVNSVKLIKEFGPEWFKRNIDPQFQKLVRDAVKQHGMNETAISTTAVDEIDRYVTKGIEAHLPAIGIPVKIIAVTVGRANPPDAIKHQRVETATQEQRINTEKQRKLAEDSRIAAERARAVADNAYRNEMGLSPEQFIRLEAIKMQREVCGANASKCAFVLPSTIAAINVP
jgi:regulator of protease activity HflC (stomatin/prohibitin superfamily)